VSGYTLLDERTRAVASAALEVASATARAPRSDVCSVGPLQQVTAASSGGVGRVGMLSANEEEALS